MFYLASAGYYSFRSSGGSWFIQALCDQLQKHLENDQLDHVDVVRILTRVNRQVAFDKQSVSVAKPEFHKKKQMPSFMSMLTCEVYLSKAE